MLALAIELSIQERDLWNTRQAQWQDDDLITQLAPCPPVRRRPVPPRPRVVTRFPPPLPPRSGLGEAKTPTQGICDATTPTGSALLAEENYTTPTPNRPISTPVSFPLADHQFHNIYGSPLYDEPIPFTSPILSPEPSITSPESGSDDGISPTTSVSDNSSVYSGHFSPLGSIAASVFNQESTHYPMNRSRDQTPIAISDPAPSHLSQIPDSPTSYFPPLESLNGYPERRTAFVDSNSIKLTHQTSKQICSTPKQEYAIPDMRLFSYRSIHGSNTY